MCPPIHYILIDHEPIAAPDILKWAAWMESAESCFVDRTRVGPYTVSTVFLGIDHNFSPNGPPILFETMAWTDIPHELQGLSEIGPQVMPRTFEELQYRCSTWDEALIQHRRVVSELKQPGDEIEELLQLKDLHENQD